MLGGSVLAEDGDVGEEYDVHQEGVDDGWGGNHGVGKDEGAGGDCDGLGGILHADFDDDGPLLGLPETEQHADKGCDKDGGDDEGSGGEAEGTELGDDDFLVLDEEDGSKQHQGWKGTFGEDFVDLTGWTFGPTTYADAYDDGQEHGEEVLLQEVSYGQGDTYGVAKTGGGCLHDERQREQGDDGAEGGEGYGRCRPPADCFQGTR